MDNYQNQIKAVATTGTTKQQTINIRIVSTRRNNINALVIGFYKTATDGTAGTRRNKAKDPTAQ